jgi:WD40 repeat protein
MVLNTLLTLAAGGHGINCGAPEVATGSRDGTVKVWDVRQGEKPVAEILPKSNNNRDCWAVAFGNSFNDQERVLASGYDNGDLKLFDLRSMSVLWETNIANGICDIEFDRRDIQMNKLVAVGLEGKISLFDMRTQHPSDGFASLNLKTPDTSTIWAVKHLPQNREIFITSGANSLNLYHYNYPNARSKKDSNGQMQGVVGSLNLLNHAIVAEQPVNSFDWNRDKMGLCVFTGYDQMVRVGIITKLNQF